MYIFFDVLKSTHYANNGSVATGRNRNLLLFIFEAALYSAEKADNEE